MNPSMQAMRGRRHALQADRQPDRGEGQGSRQGLHEMKNTSDDNLGEKSPRWDDWNGPRRKCSGDGRRRAGKSNQGFTIPPNKAVPARHATFREPVWTGGPIGVSVLISTRTVRKAEAKGLELGLGFGARAPGKQRSKMACRLTGGCGWNFSLLFLEATKNNHKVKWVCSLYPLLVRIVTRV
jgi:hypothetical protein